MKSLKWIVLFLAMATFWSCESRLPFAPKDGNAISVHMAVDLSPIGATSSQLTSMTIRVTADDMDTVSANLSLQSGYASGTLSIPAGSNRTFTATGYVSDLAVLSGSTTVDLENGKSTAVNIDLNFLVPSVILTPSRSLVQTDSLLSIELAARQMLDLATFGVRIEFDPNFLRVEELIRKDDFLKSQGGSVNQMTFSRNNTDGSVEIILGIFPSTKAVSGDGSLAQIIFKALQPGQIALSLQTDPAIDPDLGLYDSQANRIEPLTLSGSVIIGSTP